LIILKSQLDIFGTLKVLSHEFKSDPSGYVTLKRKLVSFKVLKVLEIPHRNKKIGLE